MKDLRSGVAVITGAAGGLGKALAAEFYRRGYHLALLDVDSGGLEQTRQELEQVGQPITIHPTDVSDPEKVAAAREEILRIHGNVHILVNNAGISISRNFENLDPADFRRLMEVNFWGTIYCTRAFLPVLQQQGSARIVNIISGFARMGFPGKTAYAASKSAVLGFSHSLSTELEGSGIRVCAVIPPPLNTGLVRNGKHISEAKREEEVRFMEKHALPLQLTANRVVRGVGKGKFLIVIGHRTTLMDFLARFFPTRLHRLIGQRKVKFV